MDNLEKLAVKIYGKDASPAKPLCFSNAQILEDARCRIVALEKEVKRWRQRYADLEASTMVHVNPEQEEAKDARNTEP